MKKIQKYIVVILFIVMSCTVVLSSVVYTNKLGLENLTINNNIINLYTDVVYMDG